ncbi:MAG: preprotein translocase subunit SecG [Alphaproteobacteria bacterium]|nr:preprotein translocase subunit SecG [Alphaproteobacteria bacterium]
MEEVVLVIHLILALAIIGLVLLQRSEGGGLGIGGGGGGLGSFASAKGTANALTKMTALCATGFFITSITLAVLAGSHSRQNLGILEDLAGVQVETSTEGEVSAPVGITYTPPSELMKDTEEENADKPEAPLPE